MSRIASNLQSLTPGEKIALYRLDTTKVGGTELFFTQGSKDGKPLVFGGVSYFPVDIEVSGFEVNAGGPLPTPTVRIANADGYAQELVNGLGDLLGCQLQRIRTFAQFLDGAPEADPTAYLGPDTFEIERKVEESKEFIEWQLSATIDQEGKMIPGRVVVRDTCLWRYRTYNKTTGRFDYTKAQCPYEGTRCFDRAGVETSSDKDSCGRRVSDCELRFGEGNPLPFGGFPGAARVRG